MSDAVHERLTPEDLGLPADGRMPIRFCPAAEWSPLVISFPHVGLAWPHELAPEPPVDFPRNADYDVHTLYDTATHWGAACVTAVYSRLVADLNRAADDVSRRIVPDHPAPRPRRNPGIEVHGEEPEADRDAGRPGRGVVWTAAIGNVPILQGPLPYAHFRDRIERYHAPYHRALQVLLERRRRRFGFAILLDAHSMPSSVGPDLVLGTLAGRSCDPQVETTALAALRGPVRGESLQVTVNEPYRGGELVRRFGRPQQGLHALQLEVSRGVYMDEQRYRLYEVPKTRSGTQPGLDREQLDHPFPNTTEHQVTERGVADHRVTGPHRAPIPVGPRRGRRLAELRRRVEALVRSLTDYGLDPLGAEPTARALP